MPRQIPFTDFERSRLIVQLRRELMHDMSKAFYMAATSAQPLKDEQRTLLHAIENGFEQQGKLLQITLNIANSHIRTGPKRKKTDP